MAALLPTIYFARRPLTPRSGSSQLPIWNVARFRFTGLCRDTVKPGPIQTQHAIGLLSPLTLLQELLALLFHAAPLRYAI